MRCGVHAGLLKAQWCVLERSRVKNPHVCYFCRVFTGWLCLFTHTDPENQNLSVPRSGGRSSPEVLNPLIELISLLVQIAGDYSSPGPCCVVVVMTTVQFALKTALPPER